jgi:hypothetical protein
MSAARPRGAFIVLVGPDGVGKTTVAQALAEARAGTAAYFHFLPPLFRGLAPFAPAVGDWPRPALQARGSRLLGWFRILRSVVRCWVAYLTAIRPARERGILVVADRWVYGYLVQPRALRFYGPRGVALAAVRVLPKPDLVANLSAPPEIVWGRKQELSRGAVAEELTAWARLPYCRLRTFDATEAPAVIAGRILEAL